MPIPPFLQNFNHKNGRVREDHAEKSVLFMECKSELCSEDGVPQEREFQITSIDSKTGIRVFRCVICDSRIKLPNNSDAVGENN